MVQSEKKALHNPQISARHKSLIRGKKMNIEFNEIERAPACNANDKIRKFQFRRCGHLDDAMCEYGHGPSDERK